MSRLEELEKIGYTKLDGPGRAELKELQDAAKDTAPDASVNGGSGVEDSSDEKDVAPEDTITVKTSELQRMIHEAAQELADKNGTGPVKKELGQWKKYVPPKERNKIATIAMYQEDATKPLGVVVDWHRLKKVFNEDTRKYDKMIYRVYVQYEKEKKEYDVDWVKFIIDDTQRENVEILEMKREEMVRNHGEVYRPPKGKDGYLRGKGFQVDVNAASGGVWVDQLEISEKITCKVKRKSGEVFTLPAERLNP